MPEIDLTTNLVIESNVYIIKERTIRLDPRFISKIHDFKALEILKKDHFVLTRDQAREFKEASLSCSFCDDKCDYVWGTIVDNDGNKVNVCVCTKTDCELFAECRPGIKPDELKHYDNNQHIHLGMDSGISE